jgi:hypothetical protein
MADRHAFVCLLGMQYIITSYIYCTIVLAFRSIVFIQHVTINFLAGTDNSAMYERMNNQKLPADS